MDKIRVYNKQKFNVGVKTFNHPLGITIPAGSFVPMDQDEISQ